LHKDNVNAIIIGREETVDKMTIAYSNSSSLLKNSQSNSRNFDNEGMRFFLAMVDEWDAIACLSIPKLTIKLRKEAIFSLGISSITFAIVIIGILSCKI
jgi:hypothetical protein